MEAKTVSLGGVFTIQVSSVVLQGCVKVLVQAVVCERERIDEYYL